MRVSTCTTCARTLTTEVPLLALSKNQVVPSQVLHGSGRSKPDPSLASAGTMAHDRLLYLLQQACSYEEEASMVQECLRTLHQRNQHRASLSAAEAHRWAEQGLVEALASFLGETQGFLQHVIHHGVAQQVLLYGHQRVYTCPPVRTRLVAPDSCACA